VSDVRGNESTFEEATATLETPRDTLVPGLLAREIALKAAGKTVAEVV
jgi:hypothetical protein